MSEGLKRRLGIGPGHTVTAINGTDVHDFVAGLRGKTVLSYDPHYKHVFMNELLPPDTTGPDIRFEDNEGNMIEAAVGFSRITSPTYPPYLPANIWGLTGSNLYTAMLVEGQVAYLHIGQMTSYENSQAERETFLSLMKSRMCLRLSSTSTTTAGAMTASGCVT